MKGEPKRSFSKRQPEQLPEQPVSSCVQKIVTTSSPVQEELKAQDVVSTLDHVPNCDLRNARVGFELGDEIFSCVVIENDIFEVRSASMAANPDRPQNPLPELDREYVGNASRPDLARHTGCWRLPHCHRELSFPLPGKPGSGTFRSLGARPGTCLLVNDRISWARSKGNAVDPQASPHVAHGVRVA